MLETGSMGGQRWLAIIVAILLAVGAFAAGTYIGGRETSAAVVQGPTRFFSEFDPEQHLEARTGLDWEVLSDEPVTGEHYGNPPHSRAYARRKTRMAATVMEEQWANLKSDLIDSFMRQGGLVEEQGEDPGGGNFTMWSVGKDSPDGQVDAYYGFGHRHYGGTRGVASHHGLFTLTAVQAGNQAEVVFFVWESWPRE